MHFNPAPITVLRVENAQGLGPFCAPERLHEQVLNDLDAYQRTRPIPEDDRSFGKPLHRLAKDLGWAWSSTVFGVLSWENLQFWFAPDLWFDALQTHGFFVVRYRVPPYQAILADTQVMFCKDQAQRLETIAF